MPLVEQHTLCALEHHRADGQQVAEERPGDDRHPRGERAEGPHRRVDRRHLERAELVDEPVAEHGQLDAEHPGRQCVGDPGRVGGVGERIPHSLAHPLAAGPMPVGPTGNLPGAVRRPVVGRGEQRVTFDGQPVERVRHADVGQVVGLDDERQGVDHHEPRQVRVHATQRAGAELSEDMTPPVRQDDTVAGLPAPVVPHYRGNRAAVDTLRAQPVDDGPLARVAVSQVGYQHVVHSRLIRSSPCSVVGRPQVARTRSPRSTGASAVETRRAA